MTYYTRLTEKGLRLLGGANENELDIGYMEVSSEEITGDASILTKLPGSDTYKIKLRKAFRDPDNSHQILFEAIFNKAFDTIDKDYTIKTVGLFKGTLDNNGEPTHTVDGEPELFAIANFPPTYKPIVSDNSGADKSVIIQLVLAFNPVEALRIKVLNDEPLYLSRKGDIMDGNIYMTYKGVDENDDVDIKKWTVKNLADPIDDGDAVPLGWLHDSELGYLRRDGENLFETGFDFHRKRPHNLYNPLIDGGEFSEGDAVPYGYNETTEDIYKEFTNEPSLSAFIATLPKGIKHNVHLKMVRPYGGGAVNDKFKVHLDGFKQMGKNGKITIESEISVYDNYRSPTIARTVAGSIGSIWMVLSPISSIYTAMITSIL